MALDVCLGRYVFFLMVFDCLFKISTWEISEIPQETPS